MSIADITSVMDIFCELEKSSDSTESAESYLIDALDLLSAEVLFWWNVRWTKVNPAYYSAEYNSYFIRH